MYFSCPGFGAETSEFGDVLVMSLHFFNRGSCPCRSRFV